MGNQSWYFALSLGVFLLFVQSGIIAGHEWGYTGDEGPDHWAEENELCDGQHQSPINIDSQSAVYNSDLSGIDFVYDVTEDPVTKISNNGHTMTMETTAEVLVEGGGLEDTYKVAQAHLHWGSSSTVGSEHTLDAHAYPLEMHIVTYDFEKYDSEVEAEGGLGSVLASGDESGLAVFGIFFTLASQNNSQLAPLMAHMDEIHAAQSAKVEIPDFHIWDLLPSSTRDYFRYSGSLTTPTCNEVVAWTLFDEKNTISEYQLNRLRSLHDGADHAMEDNYRPLQDLNGRVVEKSFETPSYGVEGEITEDPNGGATDHTVSILLPSVIISILYRFM